MAPVLQEALPNHMVNTNCQVNPCTAFLHFFRLHIMLIMQLPYCAADDIPKYSIFLRQILWHLSHIIAQDCYTVIQKSSVFFLAYPKSEWHS